MRVPLSVVAPVLVFISTAANAQSPPPLPGKLVGEYFQQSGGGKKRWVVPVELSEIKAEGDKVSGVVSKYQTPNGGCVASNTPFSGTYQDGVLSIKSKPMTSQKADGSNCGGIEVHVKLTGGHGVGTFGQGSDKGIQIEFDAK